MTYESAHHRVRRERGSARQYSCRHCGRPAEHWAYDHLDPNHQVGKRGMRFSMKPSHYLPLCHRCHQVFDWGIDAYWVLAKVLDTPCPRCDARPGFDCRTASGTVMSGVTFQHTGRKRLSGVDTRPEYMIRFEELRAAASLI